MESAAAGGSVSAEVAELRRLQADTSSALARALLEYGVRALYSRLTDDAKELDALAAQAATAEVRTVLQESAAALRAQLPGGTAEKPPGASDAPAADDGDEADDEADDDAKSSVAESLPESAAEEEVAAAAAAALPPELDVATWELTDVSALPPGSWVPRLLPLRCIPRAKHDSELARQFLEARMPVVLVGTGLAATAVGKWTPEFLREQMDPALCTVYKSVQVPRSLRRPPAPPSFTRALMPCALTHRRVGAAFAPLPLLGRREERGRLRVQRGRSHREAFDDRRSVHQGCRAGRGRRGGRLGRRGWRVWRVCAVLSADAAGRRCARRYARRLQEVRVGVGERPRESSPRTWTPEEPRLHSPRGHPSSRVCESAEPASSRRAR